MLRMRDGSRLALQIRGCNQFLNARPGRMVSFASTGQGVIILNDSTTDLTLWRDITIGMQLVVPGLHGVSQDTEIQR